MERFTFSRHMPRSGYGYGYGNGNGFDLNQPETHVSEFEFRISNFEFFGTGDRRVT